MLNIHKITARDLPDLWFMSVHDILDHGQRFTIDRGSYAGQTRLEYDYFVGHVLYPGTLPLLPDIPEHIGIPNPVSDDYLDKYVEYLMTPKREPGEDYTYGERLSGYPLMQKNRKDFGFYSGEAFCLNQIEYIIDAYRTHGHRNNQMVLQIAQPSDLLLDDPPCLRSIDTRIQDGKLHFFVYFRSWSLWGGMPANLAGIQIMKEYMAGEIGVEDGEMIVESKGLHLYSFEEDLARRRCMK